MTEPSPAQAAAETHVLHRITMWRVAANSDSPDGVQLTETAVMARRQLITDILEAAAPVLREAEREDALEAARQVMFELTDAAIAKAVAAERERIRQLATDHGATYGDCGCCDPMRGTGFTSHYKPFADLIGPDQ